MTLSSATPSSSLVGAYGMALDPDLFAPARLGEVAPSTPAWSIARSDAVDDAPTAFEGAPLPWGMAQITDDHARFRTLGPVIHVDRAAREIVVERDEVVGPEYLAHPCLAMVACTVAHWEGGVAMHAGAVVIDGKAWAVLGDRGDGKSTTLAALDRAGFPILTDDIAVIDAHRNVLLGPRFIDLRETSARIYPEAVPVDEAIPGRERYRLTPRPAPPTAPLAGFLRLGWSDDATGIHPISAAARLPVVASSLSLGAPLADPHTALELAGYPVLAVARPQTLTALDDTVAAITSLADAVTTG